jgi:DNA-binding LacI/PurR family transcriptional regulator
MTFSKRPTQSDVAKRAGVSRGTVSLVLNGSDTRIPISDDTRARVLQAADDLGYTPNPVAQMLAQGSNRLIGVFTYEAIFPFDRDDFFFPYLTGIQREASINDYNVLLFTRSRQIYANTMNSLLLADGSILLGASPDRAELARLCEERYPFVYIGRREVPDCAINWVANDYKIGSYHATRHLIDLGHTTIAFCGHGYALEPQHEKLAGCHRAVDEAGSIEWRVIPEDILKQPDAFMRAVRDQRITGLLCTDNNAFYTALACLHEHGLRVPEDVSVISLTSVNHSLPYPHMPSHVQLNRPNLGQVAVQTLISCISGEVTQPQQIYIPCAFIAGGTTAPRKEGR